MSRYRFPSTRRLLSRPDFDFVFANKKRLSSRFYLLYYVPSELGYPRLGVMASVKNVRNATSRNRVRRVIREAFRSLQHRLPTVDMVITVKSGAGKIKSGELKECIYQLFEQLTKHCQK